MAEPWAASVDNSCFLCAPPRDLVFLESENFVALAGLGPVAAPARTRVDFLADTPLKWRLRRRHNQHQPCHSDDCGAADRLLYSTSEFGFT